MKDKSASIINSNYFKVIQRKLPNHASFIIHLNKSKLEKSIMHIKDFKEEIIEEKPISSIMLNSFNMPQKTK